MMLRYRAEEVPTPVPALRRSSYTASAMQLLIARLDQAITGPRGSLSAAVTTALQQAVLEEDLIDLVNLVPAPDDYARQVLYSDPSRRYTIVAIAWAPGQKSAIHEHYVWSASGVCRGMLTETLYDRAAEPLRPLRTVALPRGDTTFDWPVSGVHQVGNPGPDVAVSIHVYGITKDGLTAGVDRVLG
jgi:predicted metal-dependent enzyme (double-stranded beta helix superfamily)